MTPFLLLWTSLLAGAGTTESIVGDVVSVPASGEWRFVVKEDAGGEQEVAFLESTRFLVVRPGAMSLADATPIGPGDILVGDRVLCRRRAGPGAEWKAALVAVMKRADLDERHAREREDWRRRGVAGVVVALDPAAAEITLRLAGTRTPFVVATDRRTLFRRYAAGSLRFADARSSSFAELALADQLRVLGNRDSERPRILAEQVVAGAYRVVRGVLSEVDAAKGRVSVRETSGREGAPRGEAGAASVSLGPHTLLRRLPPMLVLRLQRSVESGSPAAQSAPDPDELLERLPPIGVQDLHQGDEVAALGPRTPAADALTAIKLVVWTVEASPVTRARGRRNGAEEAADPFTDLLGFGGETPW